MMNRYALVAVAALITAPAAAAQTLPVPDVHFRLALRIQLAPLARQSQNTNARYAARTLIELPMPVAVPVVPDAGRMPIVTSRAPFASLQYRDGWTNPLFRGTAPAANRP